MSYGSLYVIFVVNLSFIALAMEFPKWLVILSMLAAGVFGAFAVLQFEKMCERVDKLEKELKQRKDGADNE